MSREMASNSCDSLEFYFNFPSQQQPTELCMCIVPVSMQKACQKPTSCFREPVSGCCSPMAQQIKNVFTYFHKWLLCMGKTL